MALSTTAPDSEEPPSLSIGGLIATAIESAANTFCANDPLSVALPTPTALHDARVSLRRLRSSLRTFRAIYDAGWAANVRADLGWLAGLLGAVRQVDIVGEHLEGYDEWSHDDDRSKLIIEHLDADRAGTLAELRQGGESDRYETVLGHLDTIRLRPPLTPKAGEPADGALARTLRRPWRDLRDASQRAQRTGDEADLHAMRIRAKELRYASEIAATVYGRPARQVAQAASRIQDRLGDHRDALYTVDYLSQLAQTNPGTAYLAGQLAVHESASATALLEGLRDDFRRVKKRWAQVRWDRKS